MLQGMELLYEMSQGMLQGMMWGMASEMLEVNGVGNALEGLL